MKPIKIEYFDSIDNLPLYNFDRYRNTKDLNWFIVGFDGRQKKEATDELKAIESIILDEYFKALDDKAFSNRLQKWAKIDALKTQYAIVKSLLNRMYLGFADFQMGTRLMFIKELSKHGFKMPEINSKDGDSLEIERLNTACEGIRTKIALIEIELNKNAKVESISLIRQLQIATLSLQYPYRLNPKEITVVEWIEICRLLEEKAKLN
tara:strand:- start:41 stop:664 length:624 start_codon:yes stop_codon:yes gene_type:complete